jgi:hypothetical protein
MVRDKFIEIYNNNKLVRDLLKTTINDLLPTVDFSKNKKSYQFNKTESAVYINLFGKWVWSWMNTINTNYSCLYILIDELNKIRTEPKKILASDLENNTQQTIDYLRSRLEIHKQVFFTPGSDIFKKMFFVTQMTWNKGFISVLSGVITISKYFDVEKFNLEYRRGIKDDMTKGCDLIIYFDGRKHSTQHKIARLYDKGGFFISDNFIYNEKTYRDNLDLISIEDKGKIYLFYNSKDKNLCGTNERGHFKIYKTILIKPMYKENQDVTDLLLELNQICFRKNIIFEFEKGNGKENYFIDEIKKEKRSIRFFLNDIEDENLSEKIKKQIEILK